MTAIGLGPWLTEETAPGTTAPERALVVALRGVAVAARRNVLSTSADQEAHGWRYHHWAALLLDVGRLFTPAPLPGDVDPGEPGTCWPTSHEVADDHALVYVEGMATSTRRVWLDTEHGWCARPGEDSAIDPTWCPPGSAYLGVPLTEEFRTYACRRAGSPNLFTTAHEFGRSLLYRGLPADAVDVGTGRLLPAAARLS